MRPDLLSDGCADKPSLVARLQHCSLPLLVRSAWSKEPTAAESDAKRGEQEGLKYIQNIRYHQIGSGRHFFCKSKTQEEIDIMYGIYVNIIY